VSTPIWTGWPEQFDVRCPQCGGHAVFDEPFLFYARRDQVPESEHRPFHQWGGWFVIEKYPSLMPWIAPRGSGQSLAFTKPREGSGYYAMHHRGVIRCGACHQANVHELKWPDDAFYQWEIRGEILWAWSTEHARVLLAYIGGQQRDPAKFPAYSRQLRRLPKKFLSAKMRELIVKRISSVLGDAG
jgi:hypothetical protein